MSIRELRNTIQNQYLKNNKISAAEAKKIVKTVESENLNPAELLTLRREFQDSFSGPGLVAFDKYAKRLGVEIPTGSASSGNTTSLLDMQLGRSLDKVPTSFELAEVEDRTVREALSRMDVNSDGKITARDREMMGFSEGQMRMFVFSSLLMGQKMDIDAKIPKDLTGKTICFTAVSDRKNMVKWAKAMGAKVTTKVTDNLDYLIVGDASRTGKDERALILNTLGDANIEVTGAPNFLKAANDAQVVGSAPADISRSEFNSRVKDTLRSFYKDFIMEGYADDLANASSPAERRDLLAKRKEDLDDFGETFPDDYFLQDIDYQYANGDGYKDRFGVEIPKDKLEAISFSFFTNLAGIGLSKTFVFDTRNGNVVDEGDIQD